MRPRTTERLQRLAGIPGTRLSIGPSRRGFLRRHRHQIYSLAPLAARESPRVGCLSRKASRPACPANRRKLAVGVEPTTAGLQNRGSAVELR